MIALLLNDPRTDKSKKNKTGKSPEELAKASNERTVSDYFVADKRENLGIVLVLW